MSKVTHGDFPLHRLAGIWFKSEADAKMALDHAQSLRQSELRDYALYWKAMSESRAVLAEHRRSGVQMLKDTFECFSGTMYPLDELESLYSGLGDLCERYAKNLSIKFSIAKSITANVEKSTRHQLVGSAESGVWLIETDPENPVLEIWSSDDTSTRFIGTSEADVKRYIHIANHLNQEQPEDDE